MKVLKATLNTKTIKLVVHLDETKLQEGEPNPEFTWAVEWGADVPLAVIKRETKLLAQMALNAKTGSPSFPALENTVL